MAAAWYGFFLGIFMVVWHRIVPQPFAAVMFWGAVAIQLGAAAYTCWRRTGLPFATASMAQGAVLALCLVVLALMGQPYPNLAPASWVLFGGGLAIGPLFLWMESRVNRTKWAAVGETTRAGAIEP